MMQITVNGINYRFNINPNHITTLVIERMCSYRLIIGEFIKYFNNEPSNVIISNDIDQIEIKEDMQLIYNYFKYDYIKKINSIISKQLLYKLHDFTLELNMWYKTGFDILSKLIGDYDSIINICTDVEYSNIIKLYNPKVDFDDFSDILQNLFEYINLLVEFVNVKLIVFIGAEQYFSKNELEEIFKYCKYKEVGVFLIESYRKYEFCDEECLIIDNDLCEICVK